MTTEQRSRTVEVQRKPILTPNRNSTPSPEIPPGAIIVPKEVINILSDNHAFLTLMSELEIYNIDATRKTLGMVVRGNLQGKTVFSSNEMLMLFPEDPDYSSRLNQARRGMHSSERVLNRFGLTINSTPKPTTTDEKTGKEINGFYLYTLKKQETPIKKPPTKALTPTQPESNGKTAESQSRIEDGQSEERTLTHKDIKKMCGRSIEAIQSKASSIRKRSDSGLGELIKNVYLYSKTEAELIIEELEETSSNGLSLKDMQAAKLARKDREKARQRERGKARIDQANQLQQVPVDFTDTILFHLKNKPIGNGKKPLNDDDNKPLGDLTTDFQEALRQSTVHKEALELLISRCSPKQLKQLILLYFVKALNDTSTTPQQETVIEKMERRKKAWLIQELGGVEKITSAVKEHFSPEEESVVTSSPER